MCDKCVKKSLFNAEIIYKLKIPQESIDQFKAYLKASSHDKVRDDHQNCATSIEESIKILDEDDYAQALFALISSFKIMLEASQKENLRLRDLIETLAEKSLND